jgi:hypothetical protein
MSAEHDGCGVSADCILADFVPEPFEVIADWDFEEGGNILTAELEFGCEGNWHQFEVKCIADEDFEQEYGRPTYLVLGAVGPVEVTRCSDWVAFSEFCCANDGLDKILNMIRRDIIKAGHEFYELIRPYDDIPQYKAQPE